VEAPSPPLRSGIRSLLVMAALLSAPTVAAGDDPPARPDPSAEPQPAESRTTESQPPQEAPGDEPSVRPRVELKRQLTNRGAVDETSRTTLRVELLLRSVVSVLRLDVPFVDKNNSFTSDPTNAGIGDLKTRVGFAPLPVPAAPLAFYVDFTFPTAADSLGQGKYILIPGVWAPYRLPFSWRAPAVSFIPLVEQYIGVAGDPARAAVDCTKIELKLEARWEHWLVSLNPKPLIDWTKGPSTAAVLELEGDWEPTRHWRLWVKFGQRLWGTSLPTTYDELAELGVRWTF